MNTPAEHAVEAPASAVLLAEAGWFEVLDDLHGGLCHDLNGRVSSLDGLLQILQLDGPDDTNVISYIESEAGRLAETVQVLRTLSGRLDVPPQALAAQDLVTRALALHRRHRGLEIHQHRYEMTQDLPPFRASLPRVLRVLLVVLSRAGRDARASTESRISGLYVKGTVRNGDPAVEVRWDPDAETAWDPRGLADVTGPLGRILSADGAVLELDEDAAVLVFPALKLPTSAD